MSAHCFWTTFSTVLATLLIFGCSEEPPSSDVGTIQAALNEENGGLTTDDEEAAFGDPKVSDTPELITEISPDSADTVGGEVRSQADAAIAEAETTTVNGRTSLLLLDWGPTALEGAAAEEILANPRISVDCGALDPRWGFGFGDDEGLDSPRESPQAVAFISSIYNHHDGMLLAFFDSDGTCTAESQLHFESQALSATVHIPLLDVAAAGLLAHDTGEGLMLTLSFLRVEAEVEGSCAKAFLRGRWVPATDENGVVREDLGRFYGYALDRTGALRGYFRSIFGTPSEGRFMGEQVFYGKVIDPDGRFAGFFVGRFSDGEIGGGLHLETGYDSRFLGGTVDGLYTSRSGDDLPGGVFSGRFVSLPCEYALDVTPFEE